MNFISEMKIYTRFQVLKKIASNFEVSHSPPLKNQKKRFITKDVRWISSKTGQGFETEQYSFMEFQEFFLCYFRPWELRGLIVISVLSGGFEKFLQRVKFTKFTSKRISILSFSLQKNQTPSPQFFSDNVILKLYGPQGFSSNFFH